jgi:hypothetical protein
MHVMVPAAARLDTLKLDVRQHHIDQAISSQEGAEIIVISDRVGAEHARPAGS